MSWNGLYKFLIVTFLNNWSIKIGQVMDNQKEKTSKQNWQPDKRLVTRSKPFLLFMIIFVKRDWVRRQKGSKNFLGIFWYSSFQNITWTKDFLEWIGYISSYLPKSNKGPGQVFDAHFHYIFSIFWVCFLT